MIETEIIKKYRIKRKFSKRSLNTENDKYYRDECPLLSLHVGGNLTSRAKRSLARGENRTSYKHAIRMVLATEKYLLSGEKIICGKESYDISKYPHKNIIINAFKRIKKPIKTMFRNMVIPGDIENVKVSVYNGKTYKQVKIKELNYGKRLGEMVPTRVILKHGKAGKGATQGSKHVQLK